jgi:hypothetical protein
METTFELFDVATGNVFDAYERESDAWDVLIAIELEQGSEAVRRFALLQNVDEDSSLIAMEDDLVDLVRSHLGKGMNVGA